MNEIWLNATRDKRSESWKPSLILGARGAASVPGTHLKGVVTMAAAKKVEAKKSTKAPAGKKTAKKAK